MILLSMGDIEIDDDLIKEHIDQSKSRGARKIGFLTRQEALESIVEGVGPSAPGRPPHAHKNSPLKRFLNYSYDTSTSSVVVGPQLLTRRSRDAVVATERGGQSLDVRGRVVRVPARPFMGPAFENVNRSSVPQVFENTFH